ncbi:YycH family regulatory protein [Bacillus horti]|uniref:Regulatory protein YycH of two-component signal transduction system YycFG n=1 Tax=Caldalkalibacillus horti TaxID=77523 RepID=A0ABT9W1M3_9BACI|nr:two-component system activity regulator YycH [Bacillus horti]MDQ0167142.1 regulatory protein YycH of two-component signal transduction system YycFG [Bacillus horti]
MIEKLKTVLLIGLIASSIVLTWQIWTYQPRYDYLLPTEYVTQEGIAERRELQDLIQPEKILYYFGDERITASSPDSVEYTNVIKQQMKNWSFTGFREVEGNQRQWNDLRTRYEAIEFAFPTNLPLSTLGELFTLNTGDTQYSDVGSMFLYINPVMDNVFAFFINYDEQRFLRSNTSINSSELRQYLALGENKPEQTAILLYDNPDPNQLDQYIYVTDEPVEMTEYHYFFRRIQIDTLISYLFVDPLLVRQIQDRSGEVFYTDGTRGLQLASGLTMNYVHPLAITQREGDASDNQFIQRATQFVNQHRGWERGYYLYNYHNPNAYEASIEFRRYMNQYPVFSDHPDEEQNVIQLDIQDGRVVSYYRSLLQLDSVMDDRRRELPSGLQMIEELERLEIPLEEVEDMFLGYAYTYNDNSISYRPRWIIEWKNGQRSFIRQVEDLYPLSRIQEELEEGNNELE